MGADFQTRSDAIYQAHADNNYRQTNKLFCVLFVVQWFAGIVTAIFLTPQTWTGTTSSIHPHLIEAIVGGALIAAAPLTMMKLLPTAQITRHVVAVAQMLSSALLIDVSGGRIETHFHIFGSLAFLAFYRDWKVLLSATVVVAIDHFVRGIFAPLSVYGVLTASPLRSVEHACWVLFLDIFLIHSCMRSCREMREISDQRAELESTNETIEQKVIEQTYEIAAKEQQTQNILNTAEDAIFALDRNGAIQSANPAAVRLFGYSASALCSMNLQEVVPMFDEEKATLTFAEFAKAFFLGDRDACIELNGVRQNGETCPVELSLGRVEMQDEVMYTAIIRNIAERKQAERRVNEFYSTISHELRSPLTSIRGALALIESGDFGEIPPTALELVSIANGSTKRLIRLINDILDLRKIEAGKMELDITTVSANAVIKSTADGLLGMAERAQVKIKTTCESELSVQGDEDRLVQVATNFVSNAIKFSPEGSEVALSLTHSDGMVRFSVTDQGTGIAEEDFPKLFTKFQQLDQSDSRNGEGTGLGLAICKALIEQHKGTIGFESKLGVGSTFWFEVPGTVVSKAAPSVAVVLSDSDRTVLLVEDDEDLSSVLKAMLRCEGYECIHAPTLAEAEKILHNVLPNAVIMDLHLPDGSGLQFIERLQKEPSTSLLPVVVMTGSDLKRTDEHQMVIDWLQKPFADDRLLSAIQAAVATHAGPKETPVVLVVDDDPQTRQVVSHQITKLGAVCLEAEDGAQAVMIARSQKPDLMILDISMPRPNGFEVVDILRHNHPKNMRLIVYSAVDLSETERNNLTLGITRHINKASRSEKEFLSAVKELLNCRSAKDPETRSGQLVCVGEKKEVY